MSQCSGRHPETGGDLQPRTRQLDMADLSWGDTGSRGTPMDMLTRKSWWLDIKEGSLIVSLRHFYLRAEQNLTREIPVIIFLEPYKTLQTEQDMIIMTEQLHWEKRSPVLLRVASSIPVNRAPDSR